MFAHISQPYIFHTMLQKIGIIKIGGLHYVKNLHVILEIYFYNFYQ